jgi:ribulose-5-phosphate 4-epimerase/fuculose-1-phosphate aldolase
MPDTLAQLREELAISNHILSNEGVLDAFGHVSVRHPTDPGRFLISRHRAPELVEPSDILEMTLDCQPVAPTNVRLYGECVIHGCIYQARPDVQAVCHHHAPEVMPYAIAGVPLVPIFHLGAPIGPKVPIWDSRDDFGDTALVVVKPEEGRSLAKALGPHWVVLMRRHGATVVGTSLRELVFRTVYSCRNAGLQTQAHLLGHVGALTPEEIEQARAYNLRPGPVGRAWDYWVRQLEKGAGRAAAAPASIATSRRTAPAKSAKRSAAKPARSGRAAKSAKKKGRR